METPGHISVAINMDAVKKALEAAICGIKARIDLHQDPQKGICATIACDNWDDRRAIEERLKRFAIPVTVCCAGLAGD